MTVRGSVNDLCVEMLVVIGSGGCTAAAPSVSPRQCSVCRREIVNSSQASVEMTDR